MNKLHLELGLARHCVECCRFCPTLCLPVPVPTLTQRVPSCPSSGLQSHFREHGDHRCPRAIWSSPASPPPSAFLWPPALAVIPSAPVPPMRDPCLSAFPHPLPLSKASTPASASHSTVCACPSALATNLKLPCASVVCHPLLKNCIYQITKS